LNDISCDVKIGRLSLQKVSAATRIRQKTLPSRKNHHQAEYKEATLYEYTHITGKSESYCWSLILWGTVADGAGYMVTSR
jgi:hypothetical protein